MAGAGLPLGDPQFWMASSLVGGVAALAVRRVARSLRRDADSPCAHCPRTAPARPGEGARGRLPVVALLLAVTGASGAAAATVERQLAVMGTTLRVEAVAPERGPALVAAEAAVKEIEASERRLSTWRDDSELSAFNRAPVGAWVPLSQPTFESLAGALSCYGVGRGAFDPTVAPLVRAWGLRSGGRVPTTDERRRALAALGGGGIDLDAGSRSARKRTPVEIEEGGFGKGAALDAALAAAAGETGSGGSVRIDLGGQIAWFGVPAATVAALSDPRRRSRPVLELTLDAASGSLASSGNSERPNGVAGGHLIDPRTGLPARDFGSVAIVADSALEADCLSTALFVMGPEEGGRWLSRQRHRYDAVFLVVEDEELRAWITPGLAGRVRPLIEEIAIEVLKDVS